MTTELEVQFMDFSLLCFSFYFFGVHKEIFHVLCQLSSVEGNNKKKN